MIVVIDVETKKETNKTVYIFVAIFITSNKNIVW